MCVCMYVGCSLCSYVVSYLCISLIRSVCLSVVNDVGVWFIYCCIQFVSSLCRYVFMYVSRPFVSYFWSSVLRYAVRDVCHV